ncbi:TPA: ProQ/FINO family protein [Escherichia coli]|nr:prop effector [Escherichia coli]EHK4996951.1 ProQ/FinO family protein [Escherichia coli]ELP0840457.1 ProQ/FinO family protein [Escherichia coli]HCB7810953.1 ProQ/FinO family protein [Escherichia coli]HEA8510664.1 ProQ/FinO family protein [Escherichia coli]
MNQQTTQQDQTTRRPTERPSWRHMTKRQRKNHRRVNRLAEYWPELFGAETIKPLKTGIIRDVLEDAKSRELPIGHGVLRGALTSYIHTTRYLKAIVAGGPRYGLNGQPCGEVTSDEKAVARGILKQRLEQMKQKNIQQ